MERERSQRNRTLTVSPEEADTLSGRILACGEIDASDSSTFIDRTINGDLLDVLPVLPDGFADLVIADPPYNLTKNFGGNVFSAMDDGRYEDWLRSWLPGVVRKMKPDGSLYLCGDWKCCAAMQRVLSENMRIVNRITWQREKGRGAKRNWKNGMEDIWFAVMDASDYCFNLDAVKMKRRVLAPYRLDGRPKGWTESEQGNFRMTCPSNFWDDITVPFWSMPENTDHPTQKPEKLIAKLILASSDEGDVVFDPFLGSGTTSAVASKLGRRYVGVEMCRDYCLLAEKRIRLAATDKSIQGYEDGVFFERNSVSGR